jgi:hypothetical protein
MNYQIGTVTLHSQDKNRMLDFLSDVLEFDVDQSTDSVTHGPFVFQVNEGLGNSAGVEFSFILNTEADLQEILRKYHFFHYRKPPTELLKETLEISETDCKKIITIEDIDLRKWRFHLLAKAIEL